MVPGGEEAPGHLVRDSLGNPVNRGGKVRQTASGRLQKGERKSITPGRENVYVKHILIKREWVDLISRENHASLNPKLVCQQFVFPALRTISDNHQPCCWFLPADQLKSAKQNIDAFPFDQRRNLAEHNCATR